jgi:hypothetical protein
MRRLRVLEGVCAGLLLLFLAFSAQSFDESMSSYGLVQEARLKAEAGDWESAVRLYYRALKHEKPDPKVVSDLTALLVEAHRSDPEAAHSEVLEALVQEIAVPTT